MCEGDSDLEGGNELLGPLRGDATLPHLSDDLLDSLLFVGLRSVFLAVTAAAVVVLRSPAGGGNLTIASWLVGILAVHYFLLGVS